MEQEKQFILDVFGIDWDLFSENEAPYWMMELAQKAIEKGWVKQDNEQLWNNQNS